jgi:hypothetical protein
VQTLDKIKQKKKKKDKAGEMAIIFQKGTAFYSSTLKFLKQESK